MGIIFLIISVLAFGIYIGFSIGLSRVVREMAGRSPKSARSVVGRIAVILAIGSLGLALCSWIYMLHFVHVAAHTSGIVIEMQQQTDKDNGSVSYAPTFRFQDAGGVEHTVSSGFFQSPPDFHVGDIVEVLYLKDAPKQARINSYWQVWGLPSLAGIMGILTLSIGLILTVWPKIAGRFAKRPIHTPAA